MCTTLHTIGETHMTQYVLTAAQWLDFGSLGTWFKDLARQYKQYKKVRSTINELSKLSDRELRDIGISRGDIWAIANEDASFKRFAEENSNLKGWV